MQISGHVASIERDRDLLLNPSRSYDIDKAPSISQVPAHVCVVNDIVDAPIVDSPTKVDIESDLDAVHASRHFDGTN